MRTILIVLIIMMNFTLNPKYRKTPSEDLFYKLFGFYPKKAGTAFELIATAVMWHLVEKEDIANVILQESSFNASHDVKVKDVAKHQIDGIITCKNAYHKTICEIALEAKDHNQNNKAKKVEIEEVQKLDSTIRDIEKFDSGVFFTSTDFTQDAINFVSGLSPKKHQKAIKIFKSRPSTKEDEKGRIKGFVINYSFKIPHKLILPYFSEDCHLSYPIFCEYGNPLPIYNKQGKLITESSQEIIKKFGDDNNVIGGFVDIEGYLKNLSNGNLDSIIGFAFTTQIETINETHEIKPNGEPILYVKSMIDENVDVLITDTDLKNKITIILREKGIDISKIRLV